MPLRALLKYLANSEHLIQKIAESYPVRRAAQLCVSLFYKFQNVGRDKLPPITEINKDKINSFVKKFKQDLEDDWNEAKKQIKDDERRFKK